MGVVRGQFCGMNPAASPASGACYPKLRVSTLRIVVLGVVRVGGVGVIAATWAL